MPSFASLRTGWTLPNNPIVMFNKSHSGSRLLASLLQQAGVFIGSNLNASEDALDMVKLVSYLVKQYYPDYGPLWHPDHNDPALNALFREVFDGHLVNWRPKTNPTWGWKLCETTYIVPVIDYLFPQAKYIHLIRDGRDVAFSNHRAPHDMYWRKIYFNTGLIEKWRGLKMNKRAYRRKSHIYNALHWQNSVLVGRFYGSMLRERYLEVKYEDLCQNFHTEAGRIFQFLELNAPDNIIEQVGKTVYGGSIGKYKDQSRRKMADVLNTIKPTLLSFGYLDE